MLLTALPPSTLPDGLATQLASLGILTSTDLVFSNTSSLGIYTRLSSKSISFPDFEACIEAISEKLAAPGQSAAELDLEIRSDFKMDTLSALDEQLGGGLTCTRVIEISGDRGSGKSILLLNWALELLLKNKEIEILWIDTTGDFSVQRAVQILEHHQQTVDDMEAMLQRLHISTAVDIESVQKIFRALDLQLALQASIPRMKCVVIDSVTPLLGPFLSAVSSQGHAIMSAFMRYLRELATRHSLLVLLVNNATLMRAPSTGRSQTSAEPVSNPYSDFASTIRKPALGPSFTFMTDATLWVSIYPEQIENEDRSTAHVVEVFRSKFSVSRVWSTFKITSSGALLAGPIVGSI
ncbi:P-loop containing nucleoside triphosphate hydrolase protein [Lentinula aciculospora]|uniref:P-loop containing nucleoside triphosphate hydrolase protein n=1 Tax=Lentinula aciculospora TaxID=153920 RepID=A0A9W9DM83_9AGAR|nr:P-loop containing nucleoside triphosphate hydrolase protein [Lentinula aciculospora]KAJ4488554.1 P-loop containing nucleoside triphosphate hydrolase protein [Lentinula aciculospora]